MSRSQELRERVVTALAGADTIHILFGRRPRCGFSIDPPGDWPHGHLWVPDGDDGATCLRCLGAAEAEKASGKKQR